MRMSTEARAGRVGPRLTEHVRQPLLRNGYALVFNSGTSAVLGMGFWVLAARQFSVEEVGVSSALVASLALLSTIAQLNLSNVLARFLPTAGRRTGRVFAGCCLASAVTAVVVGVVFLAGARWWAPSLPLNTQDLLFDVWFVVALVLWCLFVLQDGALSGLRQSDWVLAKNTAHGVLKLCALLVPVIAALVPRGLPRLDRSGRADPAGGRPRDGPAARPCPRLSHARLAQPLAPRQIASLRLLRLRRGPGGDRPDQRVAPRGAGDLRSGDRRLLHPRVEHLLLALPGQPEHGHLAAGGGSPRHWAAR